VRHLACTSVSPVVSLRDKDLVRRQLDCMCADVLLHCAAVLQCGDSRTGCVLTYCCTLLLSCRIDTILDCDHLLVLSNGALVEQGSPSELVSDGGVFAGMVSAAKAAASKHHH
jgi:hypothetical protein